jgi:hypothetical protein
MLFLNPLLLFGLAAVAIPPVVNFFSRRRSVEVHWGAMQFLKLSPRSRRKVLFEQWMLMGLRMAALGLLAIALAGPAVRGSFLTRFEGRPPRSTVVLIDSSASMTVQYDGRAAADAARDWAARFFARARPGDRVAVFAVKGDAAPVVGAFTAAPDQATTALELLPRPRGSADWPAATEAAARLLDGAPGEPEIVVLSDGQRFGWADPEALTRWDVLARKLRGAGKALPPVWVANVAPGRPADPPNAGLQPVRSNRPLAAAGTIVRFESAVRRTGPEAAPPRVRLEIDGRPAGDVALPPTAGPAAEVPFAFARRFAPGSHLVTLKLDPDAFPADDRQDFALDVLPAVPVLIVDGDTRPDSRSRGSDFLHDALAPARDPTPAFAVRSVPVAQFTPPIISQDVKGAGTDPRVLVLADVARLTPEQDRAVDQFLADGGGVLLAPGDRTDPAAWNRDVHRGGRGWPPARLVEVIGTEAAPARPRTAGFDHPAVRGFRDDLPGGLHTATFPRYWRLEPDPSLPPSAVLGRLTTGDPFLVEKRVGKGRAIVSAVPLDNTWGANLVALPDFVRLAHELAYHLAGARGAEANLAPGEPILFRPPEPEPPSPVTVQTPDGATTVLPVRAWPAVYEATRDPGVYRLTTAAGRVGYAVVRTDPREFDLTPGDEADRQAVAGLLGMVGYVDTPDELDDRRGRGPVTWELAWPMLLVVLALFAAELWYTRRLAARDPGAAPPG